MIANPDLVDHVHALNHATEDRVLAVETRLRLEADIKLAAARLAIRIDVIAQTRGRQRSPQMLFAGADLARHVIARAARSIAFRIAALHHESGYYAMKRQIVIEALFGELLEIVHRLGRDARIKLDYDFTFVGI